MKLFQSLDRFMVPSRGGKSGDVLKLKSRQAESHTRSSKLFWDSLILSILDKNL